MSADEIVGHKTILTPEGERRHEPITRREADEILARADAAEAYRAALMPTEKEAAGMLFQAYLRLKELGWRPTCHGPTNEIVQLIEPGSSGLHQGVRFNPWPETTWWIDGDAPSQAILFKPLAPIQDGTDRTTTGSIGQP